MEKIENAIIRDIDISIEDHNCLVCNLELEGSGWGAMFGGEYNLCSSDKYGGGDCTGYFIRRLINIFLGGYGSLKNLRGKPCRVKIEDRKIIAIGHFLLKDEWFNPSEEFIKQEAKQ